MMTSSDDSADCLYCHRIGQDKCPVHSQYSVATELQQGLKELARRMQENKLIVSPTGRGWGKTNFAQQLMGEMAGYNWDPYKSRLRREAEDYKCSDPECACRSRRAGNDTKKVVIGLDYGKLEDSILAAYAEKDIVATQSMYNDEKLKHMRERRHPAIEGYRCKSPRCTQCNNQTANTGGTMNRREVIEAELRRLQRELAVFSRYPTVDPFEEGTVLKFERIPQGSWDELKDVDNIIKYSYAALKVGNAWYLTGGSPQTPQHVSWSALVEWLGGRVGEIIVMAEGLSLEAYVEAKANVGKPEADTDNSPEAER